MKTKKQFTNRILSLVLALVMVAGLLPMNVLKASAADSSTESVTIDLATLTQDILLGENHTYSLDGGATYTEYVGNLIFTGTTAYSIMVNDGAGTHDIILDNVSMSNKNKNGNIKIDAGEVLNLTLKGTNTLSQTGGNLSNCAPAINLGVGATLTVTEASTGVLNARGGYASPAIGGRWYFTVNIYGGTVNVSPNKITGGGIGFIYNAANTSPTNIHIKNAVVNASGEGGYAAIGGGKAVYTDGSDVNITITNSTVTAKVPYDGVAAIGGGVDDKNTYHVKIENSVVSATAGMYYGAAIGVSHTGTVGNIEIINSVVTAKGGNQAAGIGGGPKTNIGNILIQNSTVTATGGDGAAGIGGGAENKVSENDKVTIIGSNVHASGGTGTVHYGRQGTAFPIRNHNGDDVALTKITLQGVSRDVKVTKISTATGYEDIDIMTIGGVLYIYLPEGESPTKVIANGQEYVGTVTDKVGTFVFEHTCEVGEKGTPASCGKYAVCGLCNQDFGGMLSHDYVYSASGNVLTESCSNCGHNETATLNADQAYVYTGAAITNAVVKYSDGWQGERPTEISYEGNISVGTATAKIEIEGKQISTTFEIKTVDINGATVTLDPENGTYNGNAFVPNIIVTLNGVTLIKDTDYTLSWDKTGFINADNYIATITGKGNFTGTQTATFTIDPIELDETNTVVTLDQDTFVYDGTEHKPTVAVTFNGATLTEGVDYRVFYSQPMKMVNGKVDKWFGDHITSMECVDVDGDYYAVVIGLGNFRTKDAFTLYANFVIEKATVTEPTIAGKPYTGAVQTADITDTELYTVVKNDGGTGVKQNGTYDVVLELKDPANYKWSTTDNAQVTLQFAITQGTNEWTVDPSISGWTYGEAANTPVGEAKFGDVSVEYSGTTNGGAAYNSTTAPTEAGNYKATFIVQGTEDYKGLETSVDFTIAKKAVTVTANDASKTYGESDPALTYTHTELVGQDALDITVSRASGENANTYTITVSQAEGANPNYEITFKTGTFTIHKAPLTITAEDKTATYGDAVPTYTVKYEGFKNGDDKDDLGGELAFYQTYNRFDDAGEYDIMPHGLTSDNYVIAYNFGKLTVSPKPITVTIEDASSPYGEALTELKATDNGIVNNDKDVYSLATTATGASNVGKYAITGTSLDSNYDVTFVNGEYEITRREITITVDAKNTVVNTTLPTYTYMVEGLVGVDMLVTEPTLTCNANIALIGEYDITATGADAGGNYSIKYVPAKLTVLADNAVDAAAGYTEELKDYDPATVTSEDKAALEEMLSEINTILADETTTDNGKKALEEVKEQVEKLIKEITDAAKATDTENTVKVENVTPENVTPENKNDLEGAKADLEKALEDNGGNYTEDEKKAIEDEIKRIDDALEVIGNVEAVEEVISKLPAVDTVKPDDEEAIKAITDAQTAYNALSDYEKSLVDEAAKANLDKLVAALVAYDIVEGDGSSWTEDSDHGITFVVNGKFGKFVGIKVDGKDVDKANYEVKAGSTIITLKASYLDTLAVGEHTITVVYTDGSTDGTFNIHAKANSPATGDNSHVFLWIALLFISGGAVITLTVVEIKKRMASKR